MHASRGKITIEKQNVVLRVAKRIYFNTDYSKLLYGIFTPEVDSQEFHVEFLTPEVDCQDFHVEFLTLEVDCQKFHVEFLTPEVDCQKFHVDFLTLEVDW